MAEGEFGAEFVDRFVAGETRWIGGDLEKDSAWFTEVDRSKIDAIHHRADVIAEIEDLFPPLLLAGIIRNAKRDMMN